MDWQQPGTALAAGFPVSGVGQLYLLAANRFVLCWHGSAVLGAVSRRTHRVAYLGWSVSWHELSAGLAHQWKPLYVWLYSVVFAVGKHPSKAGSLGLAFG